MTFKINGYSKLNSFSKNRTYFFLGIICKVENNKVENIFEIREDAVSTVSISFM